MKTLHLVFLLCLSLAACSAGPNGEDKRRTPNTLNDTDGNADDDDNGDADDTVEPELTGLSQTSAEWQDTLSLSGTFGATQDDGKVTIGAKPLAILSWSNTSISVTVPDGLEPGENDVTVSRGGKTSGAVRITIIPTVELIESPAKVGDAVSITGANFGATAGSVQLAGPATATLGVQGWSGGTVQVGLQTGIKSGAYALTLTKNGVSASGALTILNSAPTLTGASVGEGPFTKAGTVAVTPLGAVDPNGDTVSFAFRWFHNGALLALESSASLSLAGFSVGDTIAVAVQPYDGSEYGAAVMPGAITLSNTLPGVPNITFTPSTITASTGLTAVAMSVDPDGEDPTYTYAWTRDGEAMALPATTASIPAGLVNPGETWKVVVTPSDGYASGSTGWAVRKINAFPRLTGFSTSSGAAGVTRQAQGVGFSTPVSAVTGGAWFTCGLQTTGQVKCWGSKNTSGQIGDGTWAEPKNRATSVLNGDGTALTGVVAIDSGASHTCALLSNGTVKCWGENGSGQLGDGTQIDRNKAVTVMLGGSPLSGVTAISAGGGHSCAIMAENQTAKCWGSRQYGQLGDGSDDALGYSPRLSPVDVIDTAGNPLTGLAELSAGAEHTCGVLQTGALLCWGSNGYYALGRGTGDSSNQTRALPVLDGGTDMMGVSSVSANLEGTCAVLTSGKLKCWGLNWYGQVGDGTKDIRGYPQFVLDGTGHLTGVAAVAAGQEHTCALMAAGGVKCWGDGADYKLGTGTLNQELKPADVVSSVAPSRGNFAVAAGSFSSCALGGFGFVKCWGADGSGVPVYRNPHGQVSVKFGAQTAAYTGGWDNSISFTVPSLPSGAYPVSIVIDGLRSNTLTFVIP